MDKIYKSPWFRFFPENFISGTLGFSDEERGAYMSMLIAQWQLGSLPNDPKLIKKITNSRRKTVEKLMQKFALCDDGMLRNLRLERERSRAASNSESGKKAAEARWNGNAPASASALHTQCEPECVEDAFQSPISSNTCTSDSSNPSPGPKAKKSAPTLSEEAAAFWSRYPQQGRIRSSQRQLAVAWTAMRKTCAVSLPDLVRAIEAFEKSEDWTREGGRFIPGVHRFVELRRWESIDFAKPVRPKGFLSVNDISI